ncbi:hypothetical protein GE09DRAFT_1064526 [Coniochaeta sp. 2T2.1]|nr:hypothetical protein GE09DRAFT_1064526 [Coniochaeta sp. 2T2.1]
MSNHEHQPRSDGDGPRQPGRELYRLWRASQQPIPNPSRNSSPEHIASQDLQQPTSQPSLSRSTTLTDSVSTGEFNELRLALSQQSLAPVPEASFYTPATSLYDSLQADQPANLSTSQCSLARRLEQVTYAQDISPPLSEPASTRTNSSTQSSSPYMPQAFLHYQQHLHHVRPMAHIHDPGSSTAHSCNCSNPESASSCHSLAHPVEECHCWDFSPPVSLLAEDAESHLNDPMTDETIFSPTHGPAHSLGEVDYTPESADSGPVFITNSTTSDATTWSNAARALHDLIQQLEIHRRNPSPIPRPTLRRQTLAAMRRHRFGRRARYVASPPPDDSSPEFDPGGTPCSAEAALMPLPLRLVRGGLEAGVDTESTQPVVQRAVSPPISHSSGAGHTPQGPQPDQPTIAEVRPQVRPAWRYRPLTRQQAEQLQCMGIDPEACLPLDCRGLRAYAARQGTATTRRVPAQHGLGDGAGIVAVAYDAGSEQAEQAVSSSRGQRWQDDDDLVSEPGRDDCVSVAAGSTEVPEPDTDGAVVGRADQPRDLWRDVDGEEDEQVGEERVNRWLELTERPRRG